MTVLANFSFYLFSYLNVKAKNKLMYFVEFKNGVNDSCVNVCLECFIEFVIKYTIYLNWKMHLKVTILEEFIVFCNKKNL